MTDRTPDGWLEYLNPKLDEQAKKLAVYQKYFDGDDHDLRLHTLTFRNLFGNLYREFCVNLCPTAVAVSVDRLEIQGFRINDSQSSDADAWNLWRSNRLAARSIDAMETAVTTGKAYLLVDPTQATPRITTESPFQVYLETDPGDELVRLAAIKRWKEGEDQTRANVYLPEGVYRYVADAPRNGSTPERWTPLDFVPNPLGEVAVIEISNPGGSALHNLIPIQDAITKETLDMMVASEIGATPTRVITGVAPEEDEDGNPIKPSVPGYTDHWLTLEHADSKVTTVEATDLQNFINAIQELTTKFAVIGCIPAHRFAGQIVNVSQEAIQGVSEALTAKVKRQQVHMADSFSEAIRLALKAEGKDPGYIETIWMPVVEHSLSQVGDAVNKLENTTSLEYRWSLLGMSQEEQGRERKIMNLPDPDRVTTKADEPSLN